MGEGRQGISERREVILRIIADAPVYTQTELIRQLEVMSREILTGKREWIGQYARDCITIGRHVRVIRGEKTRTGTAKAIDENGALVVQYDDGETGVVFSGEVSIRGSDGYI